MLLSTYFFNKITDRSFLCLRYQLWDLWHALLSGSVHHFRTQEWTDLQGEHKNTPPPPPTTFVDISAMREDFCMKFYVTVKRSNIHFITKFGWNLLENDKLSHFNQENPPFFSIPSIIFTGSLLVSLKRASLLLMRWGCRLADGHSYYRCSE